MKYGIYFPLGIIALLFLGSACKKEDIIDPIPSLTAAEQVRVDELDKVLVPIDGSNPDAPFTDLDSLAFLGDAYIVGMGEATHGTSDFFQMKDRLFRYLVENHGFKLFAFEADFAESLFFEAYVLGAEGNLSELMTEKMHFWTWQTQEVLELLNWMRTYNEGKSPEEQIHYFGIDCQIPIYNVDMLIEKMELFDPVFADSISQRMTVIRVLPELSGLSADDWITQTENVTWLKSEIESRAAVIEAASSASELELIRRLARVVEQCVDVQHSYAIPSGGNPRDEYMAENTIWLADYLGSETKTAVWAHNLHVNNNSNWTTLGSELRSTMGSDYQIVGFAFSQGWFRAVQYNKGLKSHFISQEPLTGSYNKLFHHAAAENFYLRMADLEPNADWQSWMAGSPKFLNIGSVYDGNTISYYSPTNLGLYYDVIIYFDSTDFAKEL
ncbi:MAG: erythromycin esterase family protein [Saprospiraceae bacterium]|nr:erythromycin esterase family protein [Saprospiraceae bacterium]